MSTNKNNIAYSASDIEKYRKGELSAGEMHDLEQAALDDPFLADAIDGFIEYPVSPQDLADLQERLNKKVSDNPRRGAILLIRRRITLAASVILLLGIGVAFLYLHPNQLQKTPQAAAANADKAVKAVKADSTALAITQPRSSQSSQSSRSGQPRRSAPIRHLPLPPSDISAVATAAPPPVSDYKKSIPLPDTQKLTTNLQQAGAAQLKDKDVIHNIPDLKKDAAYYNFRSTEPFVYSGKVLDLNNRPLAGASLSLTGNDRSGTTSKDYNLPATTTDDKGFFKLNVPQADTTLQLTVSLIGYYQTYLTLNGLNAESKSTNVIFLKPSNASLDEVVVTGYGSRRKEMQATAPAVSTERLDTNWNTAIPVAGRPAYLQYLAQTKGKLGLDSTVTGTETVSFIVSRDGALSSFKIEQSLSPAHDAAIIRLVTDGPAWRLLRGKKVRAAVTINF